MLNDKEVIVGKSNRHKKRDQLKFSNTDYRWDDLIETRNQVVKSYTDQIGMVAAILNNYKEKVENDEGLKTQINGYILSYNDISKLIRFNMEKHITFGYMASSVNTLEYFLQPENSQEYDLMVSSTPDFSKEIGHKTGKVKTDDDQFLYLNISANYIEIATRLADLVHQPLFNILQALGVMDNEIAEFKKIEEDANEKIKAHMEKELKEANEKVKENESK